MHLVVFYVVEYLKKCIILIYKWFQYNLSLCALGSGLHAPCDLSYDIEIYLSIYLSIKFLSKHIYFCYENLQCFVVQYEQDHVCKDHSVKISADSLPHLALASRLPPPIFPRKFPRKTRHRRAERWSSQRTFARISQSQPPGLLLVESAYLCFHISQYFVGF